MLWAVAGVALPIVAHLLSRRGSQPISLPTARFLALAQAQRGRRLRWSQWLLLMLRIAIVALLAVTFARPAWRSGARENGEGGGREIVIVIDASASMGRASGDGSPLRKAAARALELIESSDSTRDRVGLIVAGVTSEPVLPRLTGNFAALESALDGLEPSVGSADLAQAVQTAARLPGTLEGAGESAQRAERRIVLFSDAQAPQIEDLAALENESGCELIIERVEVDETAANLAVEALSIAPARPTRGQACLVQAQIVNYSPRAATVPVECAIDGAGSTPASALASIEPGAVATVSFPFTPAEHGSVRVRVSLPSDALEADNAIEATAAVQDSRRVLIIGGEPAPLDVADYLEAALHPDDQSPYVVSRINALHTGPEAFDWTEIDAAIICQAGEVSLDWLTSLDRFARGGGALWWIVDSAESAAATDAFASMQSDEPALPLVIEALRPEAHSVQWSSADALHEALASFDGPALSSIIGMRHEQIARAVAAPGAAVLIRDEQGLPVVAAGRLGRGRVLALNGSLSRDSSELTRLPVFPALVHEWMAWLTGGEGAIQTMHPGAGRLIELPPERESEPVRVEPDVPHELFTDGRRRFIRFERLDWVGQVGVLDDATGRWLAGASVTIDPRESDLAAADDAALAMIEQRFDPAGRGSAAERDVGDAFAGAGRLTEFWPWLLMIVLISAAAESGIVWRASRREAAA